eukprot:6205740-Pleurochrysis_carterae.AAC.1
MLCAVALDVHAGVCIAHAVGRDNVACTYSGSSGALLATPDWSGTCHRRPGVGKGEPCWT